MTPNPPLELVTAIRRYDPHLRVRWGVRMSCWIIERQMPTRHRQLLAERPNPWKSARGHDLYDGWKDGYVHVMNVHPSLAANVPLVLQHLADADTFRQGGIEAVNRKLDQLDAQREAQADRAIANWNEAAAKEAHDRLQWLQGNRVAVAPDPPTIATERHDGFLVRVRKITVG